MNKEIGIMLFLIPFILGLGIASLRFKQWLYTSPKIEKKLAMIEARLQKLEKENARSTI